MLLADNAQGPSGSLKHTGRDSDDEDLEEALSTTSSAGAQLKVDLRSGYGRLPSKMTHS